MPSFGMPSPWGFTRLWCVPPSLGFVGPRLSDWVYSFHFTAFEVEIDSTRLDAKYLKLPATPMFISDTDTGSRYVPNGDETHRRTSPWSCSECLTLSRCWVQVGMPHRGRLAFLVSQLNFPARRLFYKIPGQREMDVAEYEGTVDDVTSHLAASVDKVTHVFISIGIYEGHQGTRTSTRRRAEGTRSHPVRGSADYWIRIVGHRCFRPWAWWTRGAA